MRENIDKRNKDNQHRPDLPMGLTRVLDLRTRLAMERGLKCGDCPNKTSHIFGVSFFFFLCSVQINRYGWIHLSFCFSNFSEEQLSAVLEQIQTSSKWTTLRGRLFTVQQLSGVWGSLSTDQKIKKMTEWRS